MKAQCHLPNLCNSVGNNNSGWVLGRFGKLDSNCTIDIHNICERIRAYPNGVDNLVIQWTSLILVSWISLT